VACLCCYVKTFDIEREKEEEKKTLITERQESCASAARLYCDAYS